MNAHEPNIRVKVDVTNPGQFFACCGLLELADRLWPGAEGWFSEDAGEFRMECKNGTLIELLEMLVANPPSAIERLECSSLEIKPIIAPLAFNFGNGARTEFILDAWTRITTSNGVIKISPNPPWNFWSGQQTSLRIWSSLMRGLEKQLIKISLEQLTGLFSLRLLQKGRFGFDPGPAWNALDVGFSPNEQSYEVESSPATELFAAIGLQRFRPKVNNSRDKFKYYTWHRPYSPFIASAAMTGFITDRFTSCYRTSITNRGQYSALNYAYLEMLGENND